MTAERPALGPCGRYDGALALADARHERKIMDTMNACMEAATRGERELAQRLWIEAVGLIKARSPKQVEKMEQGHGLV